MADSASKFRTFGFGVRAFKKFPEVIPLASIMGIAVLGCASFMAYSLYSKPDIQVSKKLRFEAIAPNESIKMININQKYEAIPELEALRKEIGSYKS